MIDDYEMILSPSARKTAKRCNKRFNLYQHSKALKLPRENTGVKAELGTILHAMTEAKCLGFSQKDCVEYGRTHVKELSLTKPKDPKLVNYFWDKAVLCFHVYWKKYPEETEPSVLKIGKDLEPLLEKHWRDEECVDDSDFPDQGFIDRIITITPENSMFHLGYEIEEEEIWVVDLKTTGSRIVDKFGEDDVRWRSKYIRDIQPALYLRNIRNDPSIISTGFNVAGFMVDGIQFGSNFKLKRMWFNEYTESYCNEIINESDEEVRNAIMNPTEQNLSACDDFGGCDFLECCFNPLVKDLDMWEQLPALQKLNAQIAKDEKKEIKNE